MPDFYLFTLTLMTHGQGLRLASTFVFYLLREYCRLNQRMPNHGNRLLFWKFLHNTVRFLFWSCLLLFL